MQKVSTVMVQANIDYPKALPKMQKPILEQKQNSKSIYEINNLVGKSVEAWTILSYAGTKYKKHKVWCQCFCGNVKRIYWWALRDGKTKNCGCISKIGVTMHGHSSRNGKETLEYISWAAMLKRSGKNRKSCERKKERAYRGRGLFVCSQWESFEIFLSDMGMRPSKQHTIDRINNEIGYCPENCRWATKKEQSRNKRNNQYYQFNGESKILPDWAETTGIHLQTLRSRLRHGWSIEIALTKPPQRKNYESV